MKKKCIEKLKKLRSLRTFGRNVRDFSRARRQLFRVLFGLIKSITGV